MNTTERERIGIFSFGRRESKRCPDKMLRPFGETTIVDIVLRKLKTLGDNTFFAAYDAEFKEKCDEAGVRFVQRTKKSISINDSTIKALLFLKDIEYEYLLIVNGCLPFLKTETIQMFVEDVIKNDVAPSTAIIKRNNYYFDSKKKPINFSTNLKTINTISVNPIYEYANALYFFNRKYFLEKGKFWNWKKVRLFELKNKMELIDIDTEEDFIIAESIWKQNKSHLMLIDS